MTQRWKLTIEYDGTPFVGWQRQEHDPSIQAAIEEAVFKFCGETVTLHVAGRTDAGVHATGQVAHVDITRPSTAKEVRDAITAHLRPHPIAIIEAEPVGDEFHARFGAQHRVYCYKILMNRFPPTVLLHNRVWQIGWDLDIAAMQEAANRLLGHHDFSSFRAAACQAKTPMRTMDRLDVIEVTNPMIHGQHIEVWAEAKSFLHHQIRNIVGTLKEVGEGKLNADDVTTILAAKDRTAAPAMAPAHGLYFTRVDY